MGTWNYAAPEALNRPQDADARADVYGLGMTAIFGLHGAELPGTMLLDAKRVIDGLACSEAIKDVLRRSIEVDREKRFADAAAFCAALRAAAEIAPEPAKLAPKESVPAASVRPAPPAEPVVVESGQVVVHNSFVGALAVGEASEAPHISSALLRKGALATGGILAAAGLVSLAVVLVKGSDTGVPALPSASAAAAPSGSAAAAPSGSASVAPIGRADPPPLPAWMTTVREGQQAIASGDLKQASKLFKEAFDRSGGHGVPRTMLEHLAVATASGDRAPCRLTGLARPRSYDLTNDTQKPLSAGRPSITVTSNGAVVTWVDASQGASHAYTAVLDDALRTTGTPIDVTPEGQNVSRPELRRAGDKLVITWGDARGPEAGVRARQLDANGSTAGPDLAVSATKPGSYAPGVAVAPDGSIFVAWTDDGDSDSEDLFFRRLGPSLEPLGDVVRATDLVPAGPSKPRVRWPVVAVAGNTLRFAYRMERDPYRLIHSLSVPLAAADKGLGPPQKGEARADRNIGEVVLVNVDLTKSDGPSLACGSSGCYLAWLGEGSAGGALVAYLDAAKPQPLFVRKFSRAGTRPAVAVAPSGQAQLVWFEGGKVLTASFSRDGVGTPTKVARISGEQPTPSFAPGNQPGEWYLAWLDYEAGHLEPYAARIQCK
jgi:serine/threonine-protein kinase